MPDSIALLRRYAETRAEGAFAEIVRRNIDLVYAVALRQLHGDRHLAEDVTQQVFTDLARKAGSLAQRPTLSGWLYRSTQFAASTAVRSEQRRRIREQEAQIMHEIQAGGHERDDWAEIRPILDRVICSLSENDRDAVMMRFFEGRPFAEIGQRLRLGENAARMRVERALDRLRLLLAKHGVASTVAALSLMLAGESSRAAPVSLAGNVTAIALASAARKGAPALKFIHIAGSAQVSPAGGAYLLATALMGFLAIGIGTYDLRSAARSQEAIAVLASQYGVEKAQLRTLENADIEARRTRTDLPTAPLTPGSQGSTAAPGQNSDAKRFLAAFPEARALVVGIAKANYSRAYRAFYQSAKLTPAMAEALEDQTVAMWLQTLVIAPPAIIRPAVSQLPDDQLRAILGPAVFSQFQDYSRALPARSLSVAASVRAGYAGVPLSSAQAEQVTQIVANNSAAYQNGQAIDLPSVDWERAQAQVREILAPEQSTAVEQAFRGIQFQAALGRAETGGEAEPAPAREYP